MKLMQLSNFFEKWKFGSKPYGTVKSNWVVKDNFAYTLKSDRGDRKLSVFCKGIVSLIFLILRLLHYQTKISNKRTWVIIELYQTGASM